MAKNEGVIFSSLIELAFDDLTGLTPIRTHVFSQMGRAIAATGAIGCQTIEIDNDHI
jgi:hypothetical protein